MDRIKEYISQHWGVYSLAAIVGVVTFLGLSHLGDFFLWVKWFVNLMSPIIIGIIIAYLVDLIVVFFERKVFKKMKNARAKNIIAVVISIVLVLTTITLFCWFVMPELIASVTRFISDAKNYTSIIEENLQKIDDYAARYGITLGTANWTDSAYSGLGTWITEITSSLSTTLNTVMSVGAVLLNILVGAILAVYFLIGKRRIFLGVAKFRHSFLTDEQYRRHSSFLRRCLDIFSKYISYTILDAIGVGIVNAIFMLIAGMPNVALVSVIVGVTNLLPTFGPIAGGIIGAFLLFLEDPMYAFVFVIFTLILQTIDGYVIKPKLFGDSMGLPSVLTLIAIVMGGKLFGPVGILLSIPSAAVLSILYSESLLPWLTRRKNARKNIQKEESAKS